MGKEESIDWYQNATSSLCREGRNVKLAAVLKN